MNTSEVAIRCGEHAFTRLQKLLPQQDRLLPKIYQNENQYIIYWESIHWFEPSDKREAELVRSFNRAFDYLEECPFDQDGNILPGYDFESIILEADSDDYQYRSNDSKSIIWLKKKIHIPEYPYVLHIEYSWGDREPDQKFSTKEDAWKKAMSMAMIEADTASDEKEDGTAEIIMEKAKSEISLVYPKSAEENSFCRYCITKEKGE